MTRNEVLAYTAGLIDADGCIGAYNTRTKAEARSAHYQICVRVGTTTNQTTSFLEDAFAGLGTVEFDERKPPRKGVFTWQARNRNAEAFLREILPYLVTKKDQAELVLEFAEHRRMTQAQNQKNGDERYSQEILNGYQAFVDKLKELKQSVVAPDYVLEA